MLKKLRISKSKLEILNIYPNSPLVLIGRSPLCDEILRAPGIQPVHFLLEWLGEGEFNPSSGEWTIYDVSKLNHHTENQSSSSALSDGILLTEQSQTIGDFQFSWYEDRIAEVQLDKGLLSENLMRSSYSDEPAIKNNPKLALEIVKVNRNDNFVTDIDHVFLGDSCLIRTAISPEIRIHWKLQSQNVNLSFLKEPESSYTIKGEQIDLKNSPVEMNNVYRIFFQESEYYFRLVHRIQIPAVPLEIFKDHFFKLLASIFVISILLFWVIYSFVSLQVIDNKSEEPRIVKLKTIDLKPAPPPAPPAAIEKPQEVTSEVQVPQNTNKVEEKQQPQPENKPVPKTVKNIHAPKAPAKEKNVGSLGLLAKLKKSQTNDNSNSQALAKTLNDNVAASQNTGGVLLKTSKEASLDANSLKSKTNNSNDLESASTNLNGSKELTDGNNKALVSDKGVDSSQFSASQGQQNGKRDFSEGNKLGQDGESVSGGLTKQQVSDSIAEHRREIRTCFESALSVRNNLNGVVSYQWSISADGSVTSIKIKSSETGSNLLESCVMQVIREIKFPKAANGQSTVVIYPFVFKKT